MVLTASSATLAGGDEHTSFTSAIFHIITLMYIFGCILLMYFRKYMYLQQDTVIENEVPSF